MFDELLSKIDGVAIFPIVSLILFIVLFIITIVWVFRLDKRFVSKMANLPLETETEIITNSEMNHEEE